MYRNKALTVLQKTYDDSYLSCSTAVYYEGQGDESEAMRHWRSALEQIYEHNAIRLPSTYVPQTDTEKALQEALKQLELQCKERLDLLEALRASRADPPSVAPPNKISKAFASYQNSYSSADQASSSSRPTGAIGQGTIPAVSYSDLSRPAVPKRPSIADRTSTEGAVLRGPSPTPNPFDYLTLSSSAEPVTAPSAATRSYSPAMPPRTERKDRSASPEKRTMRTTLRSGKPGEKPKARKPAKPAAEGPSKAATRAWSALGSRDKLPKAPSAEAMAAVNTTQRSPLESSRKASAHAMQWDSHSRRLVTHRETELGNGLTGAGRHSDELSSRPSFLSVSAASNALSNSSAQDAATLADASINRAANSVSSPPKPQRQSSIRDGKASDSSAETQEKTRFSDVPLRRKPVSKSAISTPGPVEKEKANHSRRRDRPPPRRTVDSTSSEDESRVERGRRKGNGHKEPVLETVSTDDTRDGSQEESSAEDKAWKKKKDVILKNLPLGVDESAAKQILNDIVVQGDEVRWGDVAGLEIAKNALRETVVYPFLRPDLFSGLREPARGMLLFGPPGTGKTMLARAVATESRSTFFSISASSLTSKYLGESEKLVRALFGLARALAPSIIFVDEIDSLLSQRSGSGEHEATRRIKTEFLIQWSDLQRAAAGREVSDRDKERGDANRVLVLAATNLPWAIDEAARRRFVRRQYIPLPEEQTRAVQIRTLLGQQKHSLSNGDIQRLVHLTGGFSGSDITALAKDAAMGPLRSLGEALLSMTMDEIRPIALVDFEASLGTIRPSVSKAGLKEYEDWAREFGERGG